LISNAEAGRVRFRLSSDDGSKLLIDGATVVDNDGVHGVRDADGAVDLAAGPHRLEVHDFQGPRERVALQLSCARGTAALTAFPDCGLAVKTPGLSLVWLWWVAAVAALGAVALWIVLRRVRAEARAPHS